MTDICRWMYSRGSWSDYWRKHWIVPLYKKLSPASCLNYRGVHLTTLLSKVAERFMGGPIVDFLEKSGSWGSEQFAYRVGHSSSDMLALVCAEWITALNSRLKIGVFCSDIKGAFDRVKTLILIFKCWHYGLHARAIAFLEAYLAQRTAEVVVGGEFSSPFHLRDQVFQGTVLGPKLWNTFFADIRFVLRHVDLIPLLFADDLNGYKVFLENIPNEEIIAHLKVGQTACHKWGCANQVEFEASKETFSVISLSDPFGPGFKLLGIFFDPKMTMQLSLNNLRNSLGAKLRNLFTIRRYYSLKQFVTIYKTQVWSSVE